MTVSDKLRDYLKHEPRSTMTSILGGIAIECFKEESRDVLEDAVIANIEDGTLDEAHVFSVIADENEGYE